MNKILKDNWQLLTRMVFIMSLLIAATFKYVEFSQFQEEYNQDIYEDASGTFNSMYNHYLHPQNYFEYWQFINREHTQNDYDNVIKYFRNYKPAGYRTVEKGCSKSIVKQKLKDDYSGFAISICNNI